MSSSLIKQPPAFQMIFMLEIWERFGYYTVQGILTLYFIRFLGLSDYDAYFTFGAFSALVYGIVCLGGYLGDQVLGTKRTIILGLITLSLGYFSLAFSSKEYTYYALGLICLGNGLFKANPSNLLSKCYEENDPRLHGGFTLYYMAVNLGSIFALFVGPTVSSKYGYSAAYSMSAIGLIVALCSYWFQRKTVRNINSAADLKVIKIWQWLLIVLVILLGTIGCAYLLQHVILAKNLVWLFVLVTIMFYLRFMYKEDRSSALKMLVALVLMGEAILFFILYQQMPTSITLFAVNNVTSTLFGIPIDPQSFQALNPIWIVIMSPILVSWYNKLTQKGIEFSIPYKFALGIFCCGFSFLTLFFSRYFHNEFGIISSWWLVASYFFQSLGELLVSALGVAMIAELVPSGIAGFVMGMWFLASGVAGFLGASVASYTALPENLTPGVESLLIYTQVFGYIGVITLTVGMVMWSLSGKLSRYMNNSKINVGAIEKVAK